MPKALLSGEFLHNYGTSPFSLGKLTISMAICNGYVRVITVPTKASRLRKDMNSDPSEGYDEESEEEEADRTAITAAGRFRWIKGESRIQR